MNGYLLDTNTVSNLLKGHPAVLAKVTAVPMAQLAISVITEAELQFGLAKRPAARALHHAVHELLLRVDVLPWERDSAARYGVLRAMLAVQGKPLGAMDMLIAAQALVTGRVLVSHDQAFAQVSGLALADWRTPG